MFLRSEQNFEVKLKNAEGVPVLSITGDISKSAINAVKSTLDGLARAGHLNIVLNVEQCKSCSLDFLAGLAGTVRYIRNHFGAIELVAAQDRIQQISQSERIARLFRLSESEPQAICRIKKLYRQPDRVINVNARLLEQR